jgi:uncharacterized protein YqeY
MVYTLQVAALRCAATRKREFFRIEPHIGAPKICVNPARVAQSLEKYGYRFYLDGTREWAPRSIEMREELTAAVKQAMKGGDKLRVETLRMVQSALKNKDIEARGVGKTVTADEELSVLQKLVKSRQESVELYRKGGREDLVAKEEAEIAIISGFLPKQMSEAEVKAAISDMIAETGAAGIKDMGKVIAGLKAKFAGRMDFAAASGLVKATLTG